MKIAGVIACVLLLVLTVYAVAQTPYAGPLGTAISPYPRYSGGFNTPGTPPATCSGGGHLNFASNCNTIFQHNGTVGPF